RRVYTSIFSPISGECLGFLSCSFFSNSPEIQSIAQHGSTVGWADDRKPNSGGDTGDDIWAIENVAFVASSIILYAECWA
ncbi:MAG TPA: hypothetical protein VJ001_00615, partial [Rhodocyclaceae bacterium]|nr:hypothetical protein [Rhodocyclaceae bacterium]